MVGNVCFMEFSILCCFKVCRVECVICEVYSV